MNSELNSEKTGYTALQGALGTGTGEVISEKTGYTALQGLLGTGTGKLTLDVSSKNHQVVAAQRGPVPSTVYIPSETRASPMSYYALQYNYRQYSPPVKTSNIKPIFHTQNVIVKEG